MTFFSYFCVYFVISIIVTFLFSFTFALSNPLPDRRKKDKSIESNGQAQYRRRSDMSHAEVNSIPVKNS